MNKLKELRIESGKSQAYMAEIMEVTQQTWSSWENGRTVPKNYQMQFLEEYFKTSKEEIFFDSFNYKMKLNKKLLRTQ